MTSMLPRFELLLFSLAFVWLTPFSAYAQMSFGERALHAAAEVGDVEAIQQLLGQGIRVDSPDPDGWTPLMRAVAKGNFKVVEALLKAGAAADLMTKDDASPLLVAVNSGRSEIVRALLQAGADPHRRNGKGLDAITFATQKGHADIARLMAPSGVDSTSRPQGARVLPPELQRQPQTATGQDGAEMVLVPAGTFWMGAGPTGTWTDEKPRHRVYLDAFYIDKYEVTTGLFRKFMNVTGRRDGLPFASRKHKDDWPIIGVTWHEAHAYCAWAGKRLPTEAEWEKAARGTDERQYPWGDKWDKKLCNVSGLFGEVTQVGSFPGGVSPYGVYDMSGNAAEWVSDWYDKRYYERSPERNPLGPETGTTKVIRGGDHLGNSAVVTTTHRDDGKPGNRPPVIGFRCANVP